MSADLYFPDERRLLEAWVDVFAVRKLLVKDGQRQYDLWDQSPWADLWRPELVTAEEALAWRAEARHGHPGIDEEDGA